MKEFAWLVLLIGVTIIITSITLATVTDTYMPIGRVVYISLAGLFALRWAIRTIKKEKLKKETKENASNNDT